MLNNNFISNSNLILKRDLPTLLCSTSESVVGSKMASSLLSRLVVLNLAAQQHLLPHLLIPRTGTIASLFTSRLKSVCAKDNVDNNSIYHVTDSTPGLFDTSNYRLYIVPVISRIFPVRDAQIRLVLLHYFPHYVSLMDSDHLVHNILPEVSQVSLLVVFVQLILIFHMFFCHLSRLAVAFRYQRHRRHCSGGHIESLGLSRSHSRWLHRHWRN